MTIPAEIYARLSPPERIRAAISAMARGDDEEVTKLKTTCPKKSFLMTDPAYSEAMERLMHLSMAIESDLRGMTLDFFMASRLGALDAVDQTLADAASLETAWQALLAEHGIPREEMRKAEPTRHRAVDALLHISDGEENPDTVAACLEVLRGILAA